MQTTKTETTSKRLKERHNASLVMPSSGESFNPMILLNSGTTTDESMLFVHSGSECNILREASMSGKYNVFVVSVEGKPLTPTTSAKARKLLEGRQAKPVWNKFGCFGIQLIVDTRKETPKTVLGVDFGTKFEGYAIATKANNLSVMWKLPDKKKIVAKCVERKQLRRARRFRNCRRRECRSDNRSKKGFIAPSQSVIINSRLKVMAEFFKCYPITAVAMEDVCFNHRDKRWGRNFSTVEIGKKKINDWIRERAFLKQYNGYDTAMLREEYGYRKSADKSAEVFNAHCSDALAIATDIFQKQYIPEGRFVVVDDTYRPIRRRLHDTQFSKGGIRYPYSTGSFKGIRKGTLCEFGQICGGTGNSAWIRNKDNKRVGKSLVKIKWFSHRFKSREV